MLRQTDRIGVVLGARAEAILGRFTARGPRRAHDLIDGIGCGFAQLARSHQVDGARGIAASILSVALATLFRGAHDQLGPHALQREAGPIRLSAVNADSVDLEIALALARESEQTGKTSRAVRALDLERMARQPHDFMPSAPGAVVVFSGSTWSEVTPFADRAARLVRPEQSTAEGLTVRAPALKLGSRSDQYSAGLSEMTAPGAADRGKRCTQIGTGTMLRV